ncbi:hypothetical protein HJC23_004129 [Cyclotella cryptica]|uniref:Peptidase S1 domain-containing protein n=1 Tax=Cyclotella cryptica TaxID=29204 RepID=A0ABD3PGL8_9STRA
MVDTHMQKGGSHFCGGTLLAKDVVLTAGHCLGLGYSNFQAVVGRTDLTTTDEGDQIAVINAIVHPLFDSTGTWENDFALLFLARPTTANNIQLIELNVQEDYPSSGTIGMVMGWGDVKEQTDKFQASDVLMTVEADIISNDECSSAQGKLDGYNGSYENLIYPSMICTLTEKQNACKGDSGGPLVVLGDDSTQDTQVGIVSWSMPDGCATKVFPVVYSRISSGIDWFKEHVCALSAQPPGSLCGTPEPTDHPTESPTTHAPSESPITATPTETPTDSPTAEPSQNPTDSPTDSPTITPTVLDQSDLSGPRLTIYGSYFVDGSLRIYREQSPTLAPSSTPSVSPSISYQPSLRPSEIPSISPSGIPSIEPSLSSQPSSQPTSVPSLSAKPTADPTSSPTLSTAPSHQPTGTPSLSSMPSLSSSPSTSTSPSAQPTNVPSLSFTPTLSLEPTSSSAPSSPRTNAPSDSYSPTLSLAPVNLEEREVNLINTDDKNDCLRRMHYNLATVFMIIFFPAWAQI